MKLWELFKEVFCKYRDEWIAKRKKKPWKENLFLVFFGLALIVLLIVILESF